jgi:hypothetical protein
MMRRARHLPPFLVLLVIAASWSWSFGQAERPLRYYPGSLRIERGKALSPAERKVEARFAEYLEKHADEAIARYQEKFGNVLNADNARELSSDYSPGGVEAKDFKSIKARATWSRAVHEPASALVKEIYRRELKKPASPNQLDRVVFTSGGTAAGKSTAITSVAQIANLVRAAQIIYDSTLSSWPSADKKITQALEAGKTVSIVHIYRDPVEAFVNGALSQPDRIGRTVPVEVFLQTHIGAPRVFLQIAKKYSGEPRLAISVIDNSRGRGNAVVANLDFVRRMANKYTPGELREKVLRALEDAYEKGKRREKGGISETVYRAFKGHAAK